MLNARAGAAAVVAAEEWHSDGAWMTATGSSRQQERNGTMGVVYCDELSDSAIPGPLPISTLPKHATMQTRPMRIGIDTHNVEMVTTDVGGRIPAKSQEFVEVFTKEMTDTLPPHWPINHSIDLEHDYKPTSRRIYNLSEFKWRTLKAYHKTNVANGFIQLSSSTATAPFLFAKERDRGLRLCVNYRAFNLATVRNRYPLHLISALLDRVCEALIFTKLDLLNAYHLIRTKKAMSSRLHCEPAMVGSNTELCPSVRHMHWRHSRLTLTLVYSLILTISPCVTLRICSSTQPMRKSTKTMSERCHYAFRNSGSIARLKNANWGFEKSAF